ncbi:MAG: protein translocase subunit SecF [Candidatus Paceibacterota bacterium]
MNVIKYKNIFLSIGGVVIAASIFCIAYFGLSLGIDFTGGSILEVTFTDQRPSIEATEDAIAVVGVSDYSVRTTGDNGFIIRSPFLEDDQRTQIMENFAALTDGEAVSTSSDEVATSTESAAITAQPVATTSTTTAAGVVENRFSSIGPTVGSELARSAIYGIIAVVLGIILFVTFAFRKVSKLVSSWVYGSVAIVALIHDILVPTALFAILGVTMGAQIDLLFVMALLAILGFSVNDTIVVFDRIRENLQEVIEKDTNDSFADTVGISLTQTYARSINTSLTTLTVLAALYLIGGQSTELFSLTLLVGVIAGTYSSIFIASPLLVKIHEWQQEGE